MYVTYNILLAKPQGMATYPHDSMMEAQSPKIQVHCPPPALTQHMNQQGLVKHSAAGMKHVISATKSAAKQQGCYCLASECKCCTGAASSMLPQGKQTESHN